MNDLKAVSLMAGLRILLGCLVLIVGMLIDYYLGISLVLTEYPTAWQKVATYMGMIVVSLLTAWIGFRLIWSGTRRIMNKDSDVQTLKLN